MALDGAITGLVSQAVLEDTSSVIGPAMLSLSLVFGRFDVLLFTEDLRLH